MNRMPAFRIVLIAATLLILASRGAPNSEVVAAKDVGLKPQGHASNFESDIVASHTEFSRALFSSFFAVAPPQLSSLSIDPATVIGGSAAQGTIFLTGPVEAGAPVQVDLSSNKSTAGVPAFVLVQPGASSAQFPISTTSVSSMTSAKISARLSTGGKNVGATITIVSVGITNLSISPTSVVGGTSATGEVFLSGPATGRLTVQMTSSDPSVAFTSSNVVIPKGSMSASFTINTSPVTLSSVAVTFTANLDGFLKSAVLNVTRASTPPVANAGADQTAHVGDTVTLNGSASSDPDGDPLTYRWQLTTKPSDSAAVLVGSNSVMPTFVLDKPGRYGAQLIVNDGTYDSPPSTVRVDTLNSRPVANSGPDQTARVGDTVILDGSGSTDPDGDLLTYQWDLQTPAGSAATLSNPTSVMPNFVKDQPGIYTATLVVSDGSESSAPDSVTINHLNSAPVANAGHDQTAPVGTSIQLDGSSSTDVDMDPLAFTWTIASRPQGSQAHIMNPTAVNPTIVKDLAGTYVIQLIVNDGLVDSPPDTVVINHQNSSPIASAGQQQTVDVGDLVQLDGSGSTDADGDALAYQWTISSKPVGSTTTIQDPTLVNPTLQIDQPGDYVVQLVVNDGQTSSQPSTVMISTVYVAPIAVAGPDQSGRRVGSNVQLDGSGSSSPMGRHLTYAWSITNQPVGSVATLSNPTSVNPTFVPDRAGKYLVQLIVNDGDQSSVPDTTEINTPRITVSLDSSSLLSTSQIVGNVSIDTPALPGGEVVFLSTDNPGLVTITGSSSCPNNADCVIIPENTQQAVQFAVTSGTTLGSAVLTAFGDDLFAATTSLTVQPRTMTLDVVAPDTTLIRPNGKTTLTLTLDQPAPLGGTSVEISGSANNVATTPQVPIYFAEGETIGTIEVTGLIPGTATFTAEAPGYSPASSPVIRVTATDLILLPIGQSVAPNQSAIFSIALSAPAQSDTTVSLISSDPSIASLNVLQVVIPAGSSAPAVQPIITGNSVGSTQINAADISPGGPTYAGDTQAVSVGLVLSFSTSSLTVPVDNVRTITLNLSAPQPNDVAVDLSLDDPNRAMVPATVSFPAGITSIPIQVSGTSIGTTTLRASGQDLGEAMTTVVVDPAPAINIYGTTVGKDLRAYSAGSLATAAPPGNLQVNITSSDPSKLRLSVAPGGTAADSITVQVSAGSTGIPTFYLHGLSDNGSVMITASGLDYANGSATVNLSPSGFYFATNNFNTTSSSPNTVVGLESARLEPGTLAIVEVQPLRSGIGQVTVPVSVSDETIGIFSPNSVDFESGDSRRATSFDPIGGGTATLSIDQPSGFSTPSTKTSITATVSAPGISLTGVTVGKDLQTSTSGSLAAPAPAGNTQVTIKVADTDLGRIKLATTATGSGQDTITTQVNAGSSAIPSFFVHGLTDTGTAQIRATAPGYTAQTATITLGQSGFVLGTSVTTGPALVGTLINTTSFSSNSSLTVGSAVLNTNGTQSILQPVRPGVSASVAVASSDTSVGTITTTPVVFGPNESQKTTLFDPISAGTTLISITQPLGWSTPTNQQQITANVTAPNIFLSSVTVGKDLQVVSNASLGAPAPAGNVTMTITVADTSAALLSTSATAPGVQQLSFTIFAGSSSAPTFYVQGLLDSGTVQYTAEAPGYNSQTSTITLRPSGFVIGTASSSPPNVTVFGTTFSTTTFSSNRALYLGPAMLNINGSQVNLQPLRPGASASVTVTSSDPSVGTMTTTPVTFGTNESLKTTEFDPSNAGTSNIDIVQPTGWTTPAAQQQVVATVSAPNINLADLTIGKDLQISTSPSLGASAPAGGVTLTISVADSTKAQLSTSPTSGGSPSLIFNIPAGSGSVGTIYVQALSDTGTVQYTASAPGYVSRTSTINLRRSGFVIGTSVSSGPAIFGSAINTTTFSGNSTIYVGSAMLDGNNNQSSLQLLRPGVSAAVEVSSNDTSVGAITSSPVNFSTNESQKTTQFDPIESGSSTISVTQPEGWTTPSNLQQLTATVNAPNISLSDVTVGKDLQVQSSLSLGAPAPAGGVTLTLTVADPTRALIATSPTSAGSSSLTFNIAAGFSSAGTIYVQGLGDNGTVQYTATAVGYNDRVSTISLRRSGFVIGANVSFGTVFGSSINTTTLSSNSTVYVGAVMLDTNNNQSGPQPLRPGVSTSVSITSGDTAVGTITSSPISFSTNELQKTTQFDPIAEGVAIISVDPPSGWTTPSNLQQITANVGAPLINLGSVSVGRNLQVSANASLGVAAPSGGAVLTISVADPTKALLSTSSNSAGSGTLTFNIPAGSSSAPTFYVQGLQGSSPDGSGSEVVDIIASAPNYTTRTSTITLNPSGFVLQPGTNFTSSVGSANTTLTVVPAMLDSTFYNLAAVQQLRPGVGSLNVTVTSSNLGVGTISLSPVVFNGGDNSKTTSFVPVNAGSSVITVQGPAGFRTAFSNNNITATVNP